MLRRGGELHLQRGALDPAMTAQLEDPFTRMA